MPEKYTYEIECHITVTRRQEYSSTSVKIAGNSCTLELTTVHEMDNQEALYDITHDVVQATYGALVLPAAIEKQAPPPEPPVPVPVPQPPTPQA